MKYFIDFKKLCQFNYCRTCSIKKISVKEQELRAKPWITKGILKTNLDHKTNLNQQQKQNMDDDDELFLWYG